jgi:hypothetical protein
MLLLSRGMWAWAQTLGAPMVCETTTDLRSHKRETPEDGSAVMYVLAAMVINTQNRRTP